MVGNQSAVASVNLEAGTSKEVADFEASSVDDAVDLVLNAIGDNALPGDSLHTLGVANIDQRDVRAVERGEVFVIEGGPLAEYAGLLPTFGDVDNGLVYCAHLYKGDPPCQP